MPRLIITCDEPPRPPLNGNNRKTHELVLALCPRWEVHLLAYPEDDADWARLASYWQGRGVVCHRLDRRLTGRHWRAAAQGLSLPTVTRDFGGEERLVRRLAAEAPSVLLIDFISGAPLLRAISGPGTVLSGHDCMSHLFGCEAESATTLPARWRNRLRRRFALNAERRFAHLASRMHVVSRQDAAELSKVNPRARVAVIPLGNQGPTSPLQPYPGRRTKLIWGNLGSELILIGLRRFLEEAARLPAHDPREWLVVGRVDSARARQLVPQLGRSGYRYEATVDDMSSLLAGTALLVLPDVSGTGQKNRTLDGLAHGCCVLGLAEVFRGMGTPDDRAYVVAADYAGLARRAHDLEPTEAMTLAAAGRALFVRDYSGPAFAAAWDSLLVAAGGMAPAGARST